MTLRRNRTTNIKLASNANEGDNALVRRAKSGDKNSFRLLVERHQGKLLSYASNIVGTREDSEDIVQEAFVKAFFSLGSFREDSSFLTWIYRIVTNMCIDFKRKMVRRGTDVSLYLDESTNANADNLSEPFEVLNRKQQASKFEDALKVLSEGHRQVILMREIEGMDYSEIAEALNIARGTVMSRLHYARKKLQDELEQFAPNLWNKSEQENVNIENSSTSKERSI